MRGSPYPRFRLNNFSGENRLHCSQHVSTRFDAHGGVQSVGGEVSERTFLSSVVRSAFFIALCNDSDRSTLQWKEIGEGTMTLD